MFNTYQFYSASGQLLDIIGVFILFFTGLPYKFPNLTSYTVIEIDDEDKPRKDKIQRRLAYVGLSFLLVGFVLQFVGTIMSIK